MVKPGLPVPTTDSPPSRESVTLTPKASTVADLVLSATDIAAGQRLVVSGGDLRPGSRLRVTETYLTPRRVRVSKVVDGRRVRTVETRTVTVTRRLATVKVARDGTVTRSVRPVRASDAVLTVAGVDRRGRPVTFSAPLVVR